MAQTPLNSFFLLDINFDKPIIILHFLLISFILARFFRKKKINNYDINKSLNFIFFFGNIRLCIQHKFINQIVNNIQSE